MGHAYSFVVPTIQYDTILLLYDTWGLYCICTVLCTYVGAISNPRKTNTEFEKLSNHGELLVQLVMSVLFQHYISQVFFSSDVYPCIICMHIHDVRMV